MDEKCETHPIHSGLKHSHLQTSSVLAAIERKFENFIKLDAHKIASLLIVTQFEFIISFIDRENSFLWKFVGLIGKFRTFFWFSSLMNQLKVQKKRKKVQQKLQFFCKSNCH